LRQRAQALGSFLADIENEELLINRELPISLAAAVWLQPNWEQLPSPFYARAPANDGRYRCDSMSGKDSW
jgi:hypothetical protein